MHLGPLSINNGQGDPQPDCFYLSSWVEVVSRLCINEVSLLARPIAKGPTVMLEAGLLAGPEPSLDR